MIPRLQRTEDQKALCKGDTKGRQFIGSHHQAAGVCVHGKFFLCVILVETYIDRYNSKTTLTRCLVLLKQAPEWSLSLWFPLLARRQVGSLQGSL